MQEEVEQDLAQEAASGGWLSDQSQLDRYAQLKLEADAKTSKLASERSTAATKLQARAGPPWGATPGLPAWASPQLSGDFSFRQGCITWMQAVTAIAPTGLAVLTWPTHAGSQQRELQGCRLGRFSKH